MVTLYQMEESPFCDKIRRSLHWKRVAYRVHELSMLDVLTRLKRVNPVRKVPALDIDGRVIADSTDIAHVLDERWPERPLLPADPSERALCHVFEDWADESLYFYEMRLRFTFPRNGARWLAALMAHDTALVRAALSPIVASVIRRQCAAQGVGRKPDAMVLRDVERHLDALAAWLGTRPWLVGSTLTLADIAVFAQLRCIDCATEGNVRIAARPAIGEWMARVGEATARPGQSARPAA